MGGNFHYLIASLSLLGYHANFPDFEWTHVVQLFRFSLVKMTWLKSSQHTNLAHMLVPLSHERAFKARCEEISTSFGNHKLAQTPQERG